MSGVYSSGDYELFLMLQDVLHKETLIQCEEYDLLKIIFKLITVTFVTPVTYNLVYISKNNG